MKDLIITKRLRNSNFINLRILLVFWISLCWVVLKNKGIIKKAVVLRVSHLIMMTLAMLRIQSKLLQVVIPNRIVHSLILWSRIIILNHQINPHIWIKNMFRFVLKLSQIFSHLLLGRSKIVIFVKLFR